MDTPRKVLDVLQTLADGGRYLQLAEVFACALELAAGPQTRVSWLNHSGRLLLELAESRRAAALYEAHLPKLARELKVHPELITAYDNVGSVYGMLGNHKKALEYKLQALAIREKVLPPEHPDRVDYRRRAEWLEREERQRRGEK